VRRPPRGVPRKRYSVEDWFDVWFPNLSPSRELMARRPDDSPDSWRKFARRFRREMAAPQNSRALDLLAALSHTSNVSVGCYCADEGRCHRSILRELLVERGAEIR
jgi:uncharacterized protein YeaO (DUF488 family)